MRTGKKALLGSIEVEGLMARPAKVPKGEVDWISVTGRIGVIGNNLLRTPALGLEDNRAGPSGAALY